MSLMSSQSALTARSGSSKPFTGQPIKPTRAIVAPRSRSHVVKASAQVSRHVGRHDHISRRYCSEIAALPVTYCGCAACKIVACTTSAQKKVPQLRRMLLSSSHATCSIPWKSTSSLNADPLMPRRMRPRFAGATVHSIVHNAVRLLSLLIIKFVPRDRTGELYISGSNRVLVHTGP